MLKETKHEIQERIKEKVNTFGSQNRFAESINVSSATISNLLNNNWGKISEAMWNKLATASGYTKDRWQLVETDQMRLCNQLFDLARKQSSTYSLIGRAGNGKTAAARHYSSTHTDVFHVACAQYWNKKTLFSELLKATGGRPDGMTNRQINEQLVYVISKRKNPLFIIDEVDKLRDELLQIFIDLYNSFEKVAPCGMVFMSTPAFKKRMERGLAYSKQGYEELFSRFGRDYMRLPEVKHTDIVKICQANGIPTMEAIEKISSNCEKDYRSVRLLVTRKTLAGTRRKEVAA